VCRTPRPIASLVIQYRLLFEAWVYRLRVRVGENIKSNFSRKLRSFRNGVLLELLQGFHACRQPLSEEASMQIESNSTSEKKKEGCSAGWMPVSTTRQMVVTAAIKIHPQEKRPCTIKFNILPK
jgi:hypothetical protein